MGKKKIGILLAESVLRRRYPDSGLASKIALPKEFVLKLPCEVLCINHHLGGGLVYGRVHECAGEESTGKTLLAMNFAKVAQSMGGMVLWDDAEASFDGAWAIRHGLDLRQIELLPYENEIEVVSDWIADMCIFYRSKLTNNEPIILIADSIAVFETGDAMETAEVDTKAEMGRRSFKMGQLLRKRTKIFAKYGIIVLLINQLRKKVGASKYEDPDTTPLAQAMKFYASQRFFLGKGKKIREGDRPKGKWLGHYVYVRTKKNKTSAPEDSAQTRVFFKEHEGHFGYDKYHGFLDVLVSNGTISAKGGRYKMRVKKKGRPAKVIELAYGEKKMLRLLQTDAELRKRLIKRSGINTPSVFREQLEAIKTNLYPVRLKVVSKEANEEEESDD